VPRARPTASLTVGVVDDELEPDRFTQQRDAAEP
jgi:hypothetical protein